MIEALVPAPWAPQRIDYALAFEGIEAPDGLQSAYITDGLSHGDEGALADALASIGGLKVIFPEKSVLGLSAPRLDDGKLVVSVLRPEAETETTHLVGVFGAAPRRRRAGALALWKPRSSRVRGPPTLKSTCRLNCATRSPAWRSSAKTARAPRC